MTAQTNLLDEIRVVLFAGGGGADTGISCATGMPVEEAINHSADAIRMHRTNHPFTRHWQEDIFAVEPETVCQGRKVGILWASPDCTHFSKAKGGAPVKKEIRGLSWVILKWALAVEPRVMFMENVEEIKTWGPLKADKHGNLFPDPERKGETFQGFIKMLTTGIEPGHPALIEA
ncbi:MAG: DNA cytosine methyltransferase, partial [Oscillospiraceae bacterium]